MGELILPTGGSVRVPEAKNEMAQVLIKALDRFIPVLPEGVAARQFAVAAMSEVNAIEKPCTYASVLISVFNCAVIGWIPGKALGHAFFVPFWSTKKNVNECQLIGGYKGYTDLAFGNEFLIQVNPEVILDGEKFERWHDETGPHLRHEIPTRRDLRREKVVAAYCTYRTKGGGYGIAFVDRAGLDKVDKEKDVWKSNYIAMALKTPILRAAKQWKITHRLGLAIQLDEQAERDETQGAAPGFDDVMGEETPPPLNLSDVPDGELSINDSFEKEVREAKDGNVLDDIERRVEAAHVAGGLRIREHADLKFAIGRRRKEVPERVPY